MRIKYYVSILVLLLALACVRDPAAPFVEEQDLVTVEFILGFGWANHRVVVQFNDVDYFLAILDPSSPLAGPEAVFLTYLPAGENHLYIYAQKTGDTPAQAKKLYKDFTLDTGQKIYIIVNLMPDNTLDFIIQTDPPVWA